MKILVYGAGVIGSYLTHVLCRNGHDVTLIVRGERKELIEKKGLIIHHPMQMKTTVDRPRVAEKFDATVYYDAVFAVMQAQQMKEILGDLAAADTPVLVMVGNNLCVDEFDRFIKENARNSKKILFGFSGTAGRREADRMVCERLGAAHLTCGCAHSEPDASTKTMLSRIFTGKYKPVYQKDMDCWCKCHAAFILPLAYCCYIHDCNMKKITKAERGLCLDASLEANEMLKKLGYPVPDEEIAFYKSGTKERRKMMAMLAVMSKTFIGKAAISNHCMAAVSEMRGLEEDFLKLREKIAFDMPKWNELAGKMPSWSTLYKQWAKHN